MMASQQQVAAQRAVTAQAGMRNGQSNPTAGSTPDVVAGEFAPKIFPVSVLTVASGPFFLENAAPYSAAILLILCVFFPVATRKAPVPRWRFPAAVLLLAGYMLVSAFVGKGLTWDFFATSAQMSVTVVAACLLGSAYSLKSLQASFVIFGLLVCTTSILLAFAVPSIGLVQGEYQSGSVKGIYVHRNILAFNCTLIFLAAITSIRQRGAAGKTALITAVASAYLIWRTESSTALFAVLIGLLALVVLYAIQKSSGFLRVLILAACVGVGILGAAAATGNLAFVTGLVGRDTTFTGRTRIWEQVELYIGQNPTFGYGWDSVWFGDNSLGEKIRVAVGFQEATHAHNGYLDMTLQTGYVGSVLWLALILVVLVRAYKIAVAPEGQAWVFVLMSSFIAYNFFESRLTKYFGVFLIFTFVVTLWIETRQEKYGRPTPRKVSLHK